MTLLTTMMVSQGSAKKSEPKKIHFRFGFSKIMPEMSRFTFWILGRSEDPKTGRTEKSEYPMFLDRNQVKFRISKRPPDNKNHKIKNVYRYRNTLLYDFHPRDCCFSNFCICIYLLQDQGVDRIHGGTASGVPTQDELPEIEGTDI